MSNYCKCLKCKEAVDLNNMTVSEAERLLKKGCPSCQGKNFEWKIIDEGIEFHYTSGECSKCQQPKIIDILNWEELKVICIKRGVKTKEEMIKKMNKEGEKTCYCDNLEDNDRERERERETKRLRNYASELLN